MAMSRSFRDSGSDEVTELNDVCCYCANDGKIQPATHFCFDCGVFGRYLCATCLRNHNLFVGSHDVNHIGSQSNLRENLQDEIAEERKKFNSARDEAAKLKLELAEMRQTWKCKDTEIIHRYQRMFSPAKKRKPLVACIDIGTAFSGLAFSLKHEYHADPAQMSTFMNWKTGSMSCVSLKAPTVVLFDKNQKFHGFGYEAEDTYAELALDGEHHKWYFFKRFKMTLQDRFIVVTRGMEIRDENGKKKMKAIDVFGAVINYLKGRLLNLLKTRGTVVQNQDIHWVLTVPTMWSYVAKQLMREAAYMTDIDGGQLSIAVESESASLFCQTCPEKMIHGSDVARIELASPGTKHMVIDLEDDTADFTVYERQTDGGLNELHKASDCCLGFTKVYKEFYRILTELIGGPLFQQFKDENKEDYLDLQRELNVKIRTFTPLSSGKITIKVPVLLLYKYQSETMKTSKDAIEGSPYNGKINWQSDKFRIDAHVFRNLFKPYTDAIVSHITALLKEPSVQGTNIFLMVGEGSNSVILQEDITKALPNGKMVIPAEAGLTALKGAVIFGHRPVAFTPRVSKYTYGIGISLPFDPAFHPESHRISVDGIDSCRDVFKGFFYEGEIVTVGEARSGVFVTQNVKKMHLKVFASPMRNPMFVDEDDTEYLGKVNVNLPNCKDENRVQVEMVFGETELSVKAIELTQRTNYRAYFEFL